MAAATPAANKVIRNITISLESICRDEGVATREKY
jgi:hypothetical protein